MTPAVRAPGRLRLCAVDVPAADLLPYWRPGGFFFERNGDGIAAAGAAATITIPPSNRQVADASERVAAALASIEVAGRGARPVVVGALPFGGGEPATLIVPRVAIVRRGGRTTAIVAQGADLPRPDRTFRSTPPVVSTVSEPPRREYVAAVRAARDAIRAGALDKVVLARTLLLCFADAPDVRSLLASLRAADPSAYTFAYGEMIGATPELLIARDGLDVRTEPLAGSARRGDDQDSDAAAARALLASGKDHAEHAYVVDAIRAALAPVCDSLDVDGEPSLLSTSRLWHLRTRIHGRLRAPAPGALALAAALHPTPAVCGTPPGAARAMIGDLEPVDRGFYAGLVGWIDAAGDGEWAIQLRCGHVRGATMRLYAGAGIVAGSDPDAELAETEAKLDVLRAALQH
ncbi:MAG TPA: isochorismate synthase [Actinomycetota bacterium]